MANIEIPYTPRPLQARFHVEAKRFSVAVCHRRFGKTVMALNHLLMKVMTCPFPRAQGAYVAPTYGQAKRVAWAYLRDYAGVIPDVKFNEAELRCDLPGGKRIWLLSAESPDAIRGIYLDQAVMDEYADMGSRVYPEVIRPLLADRRGGCMWIGTPRGENQFKEIYDTGRVRLEAGDPDWYTMLFRASETGIIPAKELADAKATMDESQYDQEFECSWTAALVGSYWGRLLDDAERQDRVTRVPWEPRLPVHTAWDLGVSDATAIWFFQQHRNEVRVIDVFSASGEGLQHYAQALRLRPYVYGNHYLPHDVMVRELGSGSSRYEMLLQLGIRPRVVAKLSVQDGIEAVRAMLPRCWFDRANCGEGLKALRHYHREWDEKRGDWRDRPNHDWSSHFSDAFRYMAVAVRDDADDDLGMRSIARTGRLPDGRSVVNGDYDVFGG